MTKIAFRDVAKAFAGEVILDGVTFDVTAGESIVLFGGSGAGKTLLFKCFLRLIKADRGTILLDGEDILGLPRGQWNRQMGRIGVLFQRSALFDSLPVWQNVAFRLLHERGLDSHQAKQIALDKLAQVGLGADVAELLPAEISGGMQKRVGIARAIVTDPEILLLDEPTAGLDPIMSNVINELINDIVAELGATVLSITNDAESASKMSSRVIMLDKGKVSWNGPTADMAESDDPALSAYLQMWKRERAAWQAEAAT